MNDPKNLTPRRHIVLSQIFLFVKGAWQRTTIGARLLIVDEDRVLLIKHGYVRGWQLPGGGVDPGESMEAAARREALEETGHAPVGKLRLVNVYHNVQATNRDHVALYVAEAHEKKFERKPDREIAEIGWFSKHALPEDTTPSTRRRIAEAFGEVEPDERW